jgi:tetraacyldisaccharide 4'-kinase
VIVVGNITVGGTGKTPLVLYLLEQLQEQGFKPGVISRGYGGKSTVYPQLVTANSMAFAVGDEPLLLAKRSGCPVVVDPNRPRGARYLLENHDCNLIISDDGLQHYALARDIEMVVIDGKRRMGNGLCLPAGPLREPVSRLQSVDFVLVNGEAKTHELAMQLKPLQWVNVAEPARTLPLSAFQGKKVHAVAGIGNPQRFFETLQTLGCEASVQAFADHHRYVASDLAFADGLPVLMTEKDAVKCQAFAKQQHWYLQIAAELPSTFMLQLLAKLQSRKS